MDLLIQQVDVDKKEDVEGDKSVIDETGSDLNDSNTDLISRDICPICMDEIIAAEHLKCGHSFCATCIHQSFTLCQPKCPSCGKMYGEYRGNQPDGRMTHKIINSSLPGYDNVGTIEIQYAFNNGIQQANHPNPGCPYTGTYRTAYLPDNPEGKQVLRLLEKAFEARLTFTVGTSITTGRSNTVIWNDIHHKTVMRGDSFGYPDPTYLKRVTEELALKGIVDDDATSI